MQNIDEPNDDSADYPMETPRTEPDRCVSPPTAGVARSAPRVCDRDVRGRKEPVVDQAWADPVLPEFFRELASQMARGVVQACHRSIGYEDGKNMKDFLDLAELDFTERGLEERLWGEELKKYLRGDALRYWLYLRRTGESLTDWEQLRQRFCEHFCSITLERMKVMLAKNVWRGDHHAYSACFADIVAQGVMVAPDLLVGYYLANLPDEILREVTQGGTRRFADWQEAAAALATTVAPWKDLREDCHRFRRDLEDATRRWVKGGREPGLLRERENRDDRSNDTTDSRCYACSGRGHASRDCPLRNGATRRIGEVCSRCGGRDHYARDCPTSARPGAEPIRPPRQQPMRPNIDPPETHSGSLAVLGPGTDPPEPSHRTRGPHPDCRELAGLRRRASRKRTPSPPVPPPSITPDPAPESPTPTDPRPTPSPPVLDWPAAYSKCPVFSAPYNTASTKQGAVVQLEFQHRRHTFRFVLPYLHICVNGLWRICVPQFPEFLTHVLYTHHDHVTAGHRGQKKTYKALSKRYYWPGMRTYTNAWSHVSLGFVTDLPLTTSGHDAILVVVDSLSKMAHFIPAKKSHSAADTVEL
ncbi:Gag-pol, related, partial [Eimeria necatrix]